MCLIIINETVPIAKNTSEVFYCFVLVLTDFILFKCNYINMKNFGNGKSATDIMHFCWLCLVLSYQSIRLFVLEFYAVDNN